MKTNDWLQILAFLAALLALTPLLGTWMARVFAGERHLLSPLTVAGATLRNRIVMPPMWSGQARPDGGVTDAIVEYHRVRAAAARAR